MSSSSGRNSVVGQEGSARMIIVVTTMFVLSLGLVAHYLYVSGVFTKTAPIW